MVSKLEITAYPAQISATDVLPQISGKNGGSGLGGQSLFIDSVCPEGSPNHPVFIHS